ncbi:platelet-activating factor acetylhydrolase, isoform II-domain-containing protein [Sordaria brevicollis]|uniref:Putative phospholipase n=1 Tax=Sordaria brevicollis TaxID=83679 RepID=A0AAE0UG87_SORBR|nr:platelet-activating factor acetylhydrolase, isoform II-domain-containing protein [Sordaria brevicollis]
MGFSFMSSIVPAFPEYTGPYKVGAVDVEIPISEIGSVSATPNEADHIHTIQFRIYYPATPDTSNKGITWLPPPQRLAVWAYTQFLGLSSRVASVLSFLPRHLHYIKIPVHANATLLPPQSADTPQDRWPTVLFSHGLGGSRNAYSHIAGSLASHGMVVFCPEHRDASAAISVIRDPKDLKSSRIVHCLRIEHVHTPEVWTKRETQIRIRAWEIGLVMEAINRIDLGDNDIIKSNLCVPSPTPLSALYQFTGRLDVHEPGKMIFGGHSFGSATVVQVLKSTYYADHPDIAKWDNPLFKPAENSVIRRQVTENTPTFLLDMWCFPILSAASAPLFNLPLPAYSPTAASPIGGKGILAIESETFCKWKENMHSTARILSPDPSAKTVLQTAFERSTGKKSKKGLTTTLGEPNVFYVQNSAHLNQSDFGVLFPWAVKRIFKGEQPERILRLNTRAILQFLRENGVKVARTWYGDLVEGGTEEDIELKKEKKGVDGGIHEDKAILEKRLAESKEEDTQGAKDNEKTPIGRIAAWRWINIIGMGAESGPSEAGLQSGETTAQEAEEAERDEHGMEGEMEPGMKHDDVAKPVGAATVPSEGITRNTRAAVDEQTPA